MVKRFFACVVIWAFLFIPPAAIAAGNPFADVPLNHWAYDAIDELAARGLLLGYPDGTYKGKQPVTRYEMASALARALAAEEMEKTKNGDVDTLKWRVVEFKDESGVRGAKVVKFDGRVAVIESRKDDWMNNRASQQTKRHRAAR